MNSEMIILSTKVWQNIVAEARATANSEPVLQSYLKSTIIDHSNLGSALGFHLSNKLASVLFPAEMLRDIMDDAFKDSAIVDQAARDIQATVDRDSACNLYSSPFLYFKGFLSLQAYRVAHRLWNQDRKSLALLLQHRISMTFAVDIHPGAKIGSGLMIDHATGLVIGETAVVEDSVSIMQSVTLGGTGKETGDRHPKIRRGVLIGPGAKILGNIEVGEGAMVAAASVVLKDVCARDIVAGVPAKRVGRVNSDHPSKVMDHYFKFD
ncbi:MAG: serine O-acetyltransferase [Proteobacteria bacterium]|jgi:serine O-acetyltransferase|uniref:Serine acetyltransferase n=1 Tax=SAR92 bacterium BACL26 MAG-121220-bin70 TaxID=1655626 RepID=A0A0R2UCC2_9GAMM|nr:MAG: serine acetyltransferase [SAR92 bacterium BACL26 MAG-121220-bin70]MDA0795672.1 serine O-acetyltransferase [Pseudomonadota bacterium]MDA1351998.1 serine O-acetyltransferase [Pseudomonadota bacterium]|tara:strand:+ start:76 stop:873 length:798 start_codon:yes stop_codon:yes gene_type:complete